MSTQLESLIDQELDLDRIADDVTTRLLGAVADEPAQAIIKAKAEGIFSGARVVRAFESRLGERAQIILMVEEGAALPVGHQVLKLQSTVGICLTFERTLLNFLSHLSGIATLTHEFVKAVEPFGTKILATRKTLPGLRDLELEAVRAGGGRVHRRSLSDGILIKDNHLALLGETEILKRARAQRSPLHRIEIEVQDLKQLDAVLEVPPDVIMLDNLGESDLIQAIKKIGGRSEIEISGGITLETAPKLAALGVTYLSVGRLTHSAPSLDLSMDIKKGR